MRIIEVLKPPHGSCSTSVETCESSSSTDDLIYPMLSVRHMKQLYETGKAFENDIKTEREVLSPKKFNTFETQRLIEMNCEKIIAASAQEQINPKQKASHGGLSSPSNNNNSATPQISQPIEEDPIMFLPPSRLLLSEATICLASSVIVTEPPNNHKIDSDHVNEANVEEKSINNEKIDAKEVGGSWSSSGREKMLRKLYRIKLYSDGGSRAKKVDSGCENMAGFLDKLPVSRRRDSMLKTWKRKYIRLENGIMNIYENEDAEEPIECIKLKHSRLLSEKNSLISVADSNGRTLVFRCRTPEEQSLWCRAMSSHNNTLTTHIVQPRQPPLLPSSALGDDSTLIIDIGCCSTRVGFLASNPTIPTLFFPSLVDSFGNVGFAATTMIDKSSSVAAFEMRGKETYANAVAIRAIVEYSIQSLLGVQPPIKQLLLVSPDELKVEDKILIKKQISFLCDSIAFESQMVTTLAAYGGNSGDAIICNIAESIRIQPIIAGTVQNQLTKILPINRQKICPPPSEIDGVGRGEAAMSESDANLIARYVFEKSRFKTRGVNQSTNDKLRCVISLQPK